MFPKIVSNLSYSPQVAGQLTFYLRRLRGERVTRRLSVVAGLLLIGLQFAMAARPATNVNASSSNDIIFGGLSSSDPKGDLLNIYDHNSDSAGHTDYVALFNTFNITRDELGAATPTTINSSDHDLLSLGRNHNFAADTPITVTGAAPATTNPYSCATPHPQIKNGSSGDCVKHLQWYLNHKFGNTVAEDGAFGPLTEAAVRDFQTKYAPPVDGVVGPITWNKLHDLAPTVSQSNSQTYYQRPLYLWDTEGHTNSYETLKGTRSDGSVFYVMLACGNIVVKKPTPTVTSPPVTPTAKPPVLTPPTIVPPILTTKSPKINQLKSAAYLNHTGTDGRAKDANHTTAAAGDSIEYSLITSNTGDGAQKAYVTQEQIGDILDYADIVELRGAVLSPGNVLSWPKQDIPASGSITNTFVVKVKDPIPSTPISASDPLSFDLRMDNIYGTPVTINVTPPPAKQIEAAAQPLPQTGPGTSLIITLLFVALSIYFYLRNRQLVTEVKILRVDNSPGI